VGRDGAGGAGGWESRSIHSVETILPKKFMQVFKMAITYVTENTPSVTENPIPVTINEPSVTENDHDYRMALRGCAESLTRVLRAEVNEPGSVRRGRGRPATGVAQSDAERMRKYRERRRAAVAAS
jgi:hypothetical protein